MSEADRRSLAGLIAGFDLSTARRERLIRYGELLLEANRRFNLTAAATPELLVPHLADSLTVLPYVGAPFVDVGSGGGLPAIPLAIAGDLPVTMIEATNKKAGFLREVLAALGLAGTVVVARAELAGHDPVLRGRFMSATARAVSSAPTVLELVMPLLAEGGVAVLQRSAMSQEERRAASDAALALGGRLRAEVELERDRRLLLVDKAGATPSRYPRRVGIPEKRPLCT